MVEASVLLPCRNGARYLAETLEAIAAQEWDQPWELILIDNGSTDASRKIFEDFAARHGWLRTRIVDASERRGRSHAMNIGVAAAASRAIVSCDCDDVPAPGWLRAMGEALRTHDLVAARIDFDLLNTEATGKYRSLSGHGLYRLRFPPYCQSTGAGLMGFTKHFYEAVGGFDPTILCGEDDELCVRAHLRGFAIHQVSQAVLHCRLRDDLGAIFRQVRSYSMADVHLAKKYRASGQAQTDAWLELFRRIARVARAHCGLLLRRKPADMRSRALLQRDLGVVVGQLCGIARYLARPTVGRPAHDLAAPALTGAAARTAA